MKLIPKKRGGGVNPSKATIKSWADLPTVQDPLHNSSMFTKFRNDPNLTIKARGAIKPGSDAEKYIRSNWKYPYSDYVDIVDNKTGVSNYYPVLTELQLSDLAERSGKKMITPKKQTGGVVYKTPTTVTTNSWLSDKPTAETSVTNTIWGPIAGYNAASKIFKLNPEVAKQYGGSASKYANFLKTNPNEILKFPGFRINPNATGTLSPFEYSDYATPQIQMDPNASKSFKASIGKGHAVPVGYLQPSIKSK